MQCHIYLHTMSPNSTCMYNVIFIKAGNNLICSNMNEIGEHYVKWNKLDAELKYIFSFIYVS